MLELLVLEEDMTFASMTRRYNEHAQVAETGLAAIRQVLAEMDKVNEIKGQAQQAALVESRALFWASFLK